MNKVEDYTISLNSNIHQALKKLENGLNSKTLFVIDKENKLIGSITDGDIRRGLLRDMSLSDTLEEFANKNFRYIDLEKYDLNDLLEIKKNQIFIIPILKKDKVYKILNLKLSKSFLPLDAVIMAGGKGTRLKPLTDTIPKPLIKVGDKPIIDYNVESLMSYGIEKINVTINYLGTKIEEHFRKKNIKEVRCVWENKPLGTLGSVSLVKEFLHDNVLIMNSDILTNIDLELFFLNFLGSNADMAVASVPYNVYIPYAVMDLKESMVQGFKEKPEYRYYTNGGIYIVRKTVLEKYISDCKYYNATDLMEDILNNGGKIYSYPMKEYWLDIGKHKDLEKAKNEVNTIKF